MQISVVIPLLNEAASLRELQREIREVADEHGYELQVVMVDDGSTDHSWLEIEELAARDEGLEGIRFRRNFGKAAALRAGFDASVGDIVITMDADLQDVPAEIPRLVAAIQEGFDVVSGWKQIRHDPWHKRWASKAFNWLVGRLTKVHLHDHNCGLKAYRREVLGEIRLYGELHRFLPVMAAARGFRVGEIAVQHRARQFGHSKYGVSRLTKGFLDLLTIKFLTGYGHRPLHVLGSIGLAAFAFGTLVLIYLALLWSGSRLVSGLQPVHLHQRPALYYGLGLMLMGAQFLSVGLIGELIAGYLTRDHQAYSIAETTVAAVAEEVSRGHDAQGT